MQICIVAVGTRGDVEPLLSLGGGLQRAGHDIRVISHPGYRETAERLGFAYRSFDVNSEEVLHSPAGKHWLASSGNVVKTLVRMAKLWDLYFQDILEPIYEACQGVDAVLFSYLGMGTAFIAEKLGIQCVAAWPTPAPVYDNRAMMMGIPLRWASEPTGLVSKVAHVATDHMVWATFGRALEGWRSRLGLEPLGYLGIMRYLRLRRIPILYGFSPSVVPPSSRWPSWVTICGYWLLDRGNARPSSGSCLERFLTAEDPPYYVGFGSMAFDRPLAVFREIAGVFRELGERVVLCTGWSGCAHEDLNREFPEVVCAVPEVAHSWLFPQVRAVIHHGGASTVGASLFAGKPSMVIPFFADQSYWAQSLERIGVATSSIPFHKLTVPRFRRSFERLRNDSELYWRADDLCGKVIAEDGVARGVKMINRVLC